MLGPPERLARILLYGLQGPLEIDGELWDAEMPAFAASDADLAALATYIRREWGHGADPVDETAIRTLRESEPRTRPWTSAELK